METAEGKTMPKEKGSSVGDGPRKQAEQIAKKGSNPQAMKPLMKEKTVPLVIAETETNLCSAALNVSHHGTFLFCENKCHRFP